MFPSKADRILSRYRPIAPKPPSDPSSAAPSASLSLDSPSKFKRSRKRRPSASPSASSSHPPPPPPPPLPQVAPLVSSTNNASSLTQGTSDCAVPNRNSFSFSQASGLNCEDSAETSVASLPPRSSDGLPRVQTWVSPGAYLGSANSFGRDMAFMERAAANAPYTVLHNRMMGCGSSSKSSSGYVGGFTEMIRGITRLPTAADVHSLMQARMATENRLPSSKDLPKPSESPQLPNPAFPAAHGTSGRDFPTAEAEPSCSSPKLVTLPLLPGSASLPDHSQKKATSFTDFSFAPTSKDCGKQAIGMEGSAVDRVYLEQVYGGSSDPVLLVDDCNQVLWYNRSYERSSKHSLERVSGKVVPSGPYIDPLGHPISLGTFTLDSSGQPTSSRATLWGFLKKLVIQEPEFFKEECGAFFGSSMVLDDASTSTADNLTELCLWRGERSSFSIANTQRAQSCSAQVPNPCGSIVGSSVTLSGVTEIHFDATPLTEDLEFLETRLEGSPPAFITDCNDRVRWMNSAFRKMMGQREGSWLASKPASGKQDAAFCPVAGLAADVMFVGSCEKIPRSAAAFSGRVNFQWTKSGVRSSMTLPCDVLRLFTGSRMDMWVWKFDVAASLSLTPGGT